VGIESRSERTESLRSGRNSVFGFEGDGKVTKEKCDNCGEMKENYSEFQVSFQRTYRFCCDCTEKIEKILKDGVN
jgi:phage-related tail protein